MDEVIRNGVLEFRSACCGGGTCVEVAFAVAVRDSKAPDGAVLWFTATEWKEFLAGVKAGHFDLN